MKAYFSALIDKSFPSENLKLSKSLIKDLKKLLKAPKSNVNLKEHNTFVFIVVDKPGEEHADSMKIRKIHEKLHLRLKRYYSKNRARLQKDLKGMRELKETAQIVKNFLKEIDSKLPKIFDLRLEKQITELPSKFRTLQENSRVEGAGRRQATPQVQPTMHGETNKCFLLTLIITRHRRWQMFSL